MSLGDLGGKEGYLAHSSGGQMSKRMSLVSAGHYVAGQQFCVEQAETEVSLGNNHSPGPLQPR